MDEMRDILNDFMESDDGGNGGDDVDERAMGANQYFDDLFTEIESELYPRCTKFSSLNFLMKLIHLKVSNKGTNKSFDSLLKLLKDVLPEGNRLPISHMMPRKRCRSWICGTSQFMYVNMTVHYFEKSMQIKICA